MRYYDDYDWDSDGFPGSYTHGDDIYIDECYMDERWKIIRDFPDYWVSNAGRVWSCLTNRFLTIKPMDDHGHLGVCLQSNGTTYYKYIHRLVADAFIPNPNNFPVVRHIDDDPGYNVHHNLCWGTQKDNIHDTIRSGRNYVLSDEDRRRSYEKTRIPVLAINLMTDEEISFPSQTEAARVLGIPQANVWKVLNGQRPHAKGYYFEYLPKEDYQ